MARTKKFHEQLRENLEAQKDNPDAPLQTSDEEARKEQAALDDAKRQAEIMDPSGTEVEFPDYGKLRLFPFSMFDQSTARGFCDGVLADVFGSGARNSVEAGYRVSSVLLSSAARKRALLGLLSIASFKPGLVDSQEAVDKRSKKFEESFTSEDYLKAFREIQDRGNIKAKKA